MSDIRDEACAFRTSGHLLKSVKASKRIHVTSAFAISGKTKTHIEDLQPTSWVRYSNHPLHIRYEKSKPNIRSSLFN